MIYCIRDGAGTVKLGTMINRRAHCTIILTTVQLRLLAIALRPLCNNT